MPSRARRSFGTFFRVLVVSFLLGVIALAVAVGLAAASLPDFDELKSSPNGQTVQVHAADGSVIVALGPSYGQWLSFDQIPKVMSDAMVAVEDRRFYHHIGVDPIGVVRAAWVNFHRGANVQGASTITQQLARNVFLTNSRTFARKFREMILSLALEWKFSKRQILELYLNKVYFGGGAYGIDAASRRFFGHSAAQLSLPEAAVIAGLVKAPSHYAPSADIDAARGRASVVIQTMRETGSITASQAAEANTQSVRIAPQPRQNSVRYFTDWALAQLDTLIDETQAPIDVWTTLDLGMQRAADAAINANAPGTSQGALVAIDQDGSVRAMVGGRDYVSSIYNRATQSVRQPGSSFKLFVYLAALEAGHTPDELIDDAPITIDGWSPRNSEGSFFGQVTLRTAFAKSLNTVAARLGQQVGFSTIADMARRFGITTPVITQPSMVLGTSDVRVIDMVRAFASVGNQGVAVVPYGIIRVTSGQGRVLYEHQPAEPRVLVAPWVASQMIDMLRATVEEGTGHAAQIGRPIAGKTGTTTSNKDGWFLGFSSGLTAGVWMGRDDARPVPGLQGGHAPARAFADFMTVALAKRPVTPLSASAQQNPDIGGEPDAEAYSMQSNDDAPLVDPDGMPIEHPDRSQDRSGQSDKLDQRWIDSVINGRPQPGAPTQ
jgi:penicillin-binding protein 1A